MRKSKAAPPDDKELLNSHFKDLQGQPVVETRKEPTMPDPEELEETEEEESEVEPEPVAAAPVRRPPGRPRKSAGVAASPAAPPTSASEWPSGAGEVWDRIVSEVLPEKGCSPDQTYCTVYRSGLGQFMGGMGGLNDKILVGRIEGGVIGGTPDQSPSQALTDFMEMVVHPQASGPARYELDFHYLRGQIIKKGYLALPHPNEIARRRAYAGEYAARQGMGGPPPMMGQPPAPSYAQVQPGMGFAPPAYYPPPPVYSAAPQGTDPAIEAMRREMAAMMGAINEGRARDAERRGEPPPQPIVPPTPAAPAAPAQDLATLVAQAVNAALDARGVGVPAVRTGVGAPPATGVAAVAHSVKESIGSLRDAFAMFKELDKFRKDMGMAPEEAEVVEAPNPIVEDPNSPAFGVKPIPFTNFDGQPIMWPQPQYRTDEDGMKVEVEESMLEKWARFGAANPKFALSFLESASKILGQGAFGQLLQAFTRQGGAAAQAAAKVAAGGTAGVGAPPNGSTPNGSPGGSWGP